METIRWGVIGCGDVARKRVAAAIRNEPRSRLVAACRRDETRLTEFCDRFQIERSSTRADDLLADPALDAVYLATPVREHRPHALAAAESGKHVLVEKPMALSVAECDEMIEACRAANVKLGVAYYRRFYPLVQRIEELLAAGEIGTPLAVSAVTSTQIPTEPAEEGSWRIVPDQAGGGALMDIGSHRIDLFGHLFGSVTHVKALCETVAADYRVEDTALLLMRFADGLTGMLQCHFGSPSNPDAFTVIGTRGCLIARPLNGDQLVVERDGRQRVENHPPADNRCAPLVADFVTAVLEDRAPRISGEEGRFANFVMERAYRDAG